MSRTFEFEQRKVAGHEATTLRVNGRPFGYVSHPETSGKWISPAKVFVDGKLEAVFWSPQQLQRLRATGSQEPAAPRAVAMREGTLDDALHFLTTRAGFS